jgi:hypothetical protein
MSAPQTAPIRPLTAEQIATYRAQGWLHLPGVFAGAQLDALRDDLDWITDAWSLAGGSWRSPYGLNEQETALTVVQRLENYTPAWDAAKTHAPLLDPVQQLLGGGPVEFFGTSTHSKPARTGGAFPMHQDSHFYGHADDRMLICMLHLDDTTPENGAISFIPGATGHIPHTIDGDPKGGPYLDPARYRLEDATPVYCKAGDVVLFHIFTIHGSPPNRSDRVRRAAVWRYRHPDNRQVRDPQGPWAEDQTRMGQMVRGRRPPRAGWAAPRGGDVDRQVRR